MGISKCTTLFSRQLFSPGGTFHKLPIIAIGSGWDKLVLSVVEGFSEPFEDVAFASFPFFFISRDSLAVYLIGFMAVAV